jgi:UDP-N-acetylmuramate: L-alanyl-gamma-D-glutamyl-meso-diaminopimelate ligase
LSPERLVDDLRSSGQQARYIPEIDDIIGTIVREHDDGDVVVLMSNGGFGGIHRKLVQALGGV